MHIIFDKCKPLDLKNVIVVDEFVGGFIKINLQDQEASKPLELKAPSKEEMEKAPILKEELPKEWYFKKDYITELIIVDTSKRVTIRSSLRPLVNLAFEKP